MKLNPFFGLTKIKKEEYKNSTPLNLFKKVDKVAHSFQDGQTSDLFLFLYFIYILTKENVDFLVKGGIILSILFGENIRRTNDIDVFVKDPEKFFEGVNRALERNKSDITFKTKWIKKREANSDYFYNVFGFSVDAYDGKKLLKSFVVDGKYSNEYDNLEKVKYKFPNVIAEDTYFYGVSKEYIACEKIMAVTSDLVRPIKHLIDLYTFEHIDLDIHKLNKIVKLSLDEENCIRRTLNQPVLKSEMFIDPNKEFLDNYFLVAISAGYRISKEEMIEETNHWLTKKHRLNVENTSHKVDFNF